MNAHLSNKKMTNKEFAELEVEMERAKESDMEYEAYQKTFRYKLKLAFYCSAWRFFDRVKETPDNIKAFWQRGRRGYADRDAWAIDSYLNSFMPELLRTMIDDSLGGANNYPGDTRDNNVNSAKNWHNTVEKMAKGFEASRKGENLVFKSSAQHRRESLKLEETQKAGMELFVKYYNSLWQ